MEKRELKKRVKGLLALVVAFMVMFGSDLTVLAQEYTLNSSSNLDGTELKTGDFFRVRGSGNILKIYINGECKHEGSPAGYDPTYTIEKDCTLSKMDIEWTSKGHTVYNIYLTIPLPAPTPQPESKPETKPQTKPEVIEEPRDTAHPAEVHEHAFSWVESVAPTANSDGLSEYKCSCGLVESSQPISCGVAFTQEFSDLIRNAPENGIVENQPEMFRCYTKKMMEELAKRPDVSLKTTYVDEEGNLRSFTIPAGQAPVEDDLFYGFVYLGNRYGWE